MGGSDVHRPASPSTPTSALSSRGEVSPGQRPDTQSTSTCGLQSLTEQLLLLEQLTLPQQASGAQTWALTSGSHSPFTQLPDLEQGHRVSFIAPSSVSSSEKWG